MSPSRRPCRANPVLTPGTDGEFVGVSEQTRSGYQLTPAWMAGLGNASGVGAFFGTLLCGYLVAIFGQKKVILGSLMFLSCTIFLTFFAPSIKVLIVGQILCGLPWGALATIAPGYASECLPMALRVYMTSWTNMCFIIGKFPPSSDFVIASANRK